MISYTEIEKRAIPNKFIPFNKCGCRKAIVLSRKEILEASKLSIILQNQNPYIDLIVSRYCELFYKYITEEDFILKRLLYQRLYMKGHTREHMLIFGYLVVIKD